MMVFHVIHQFLSSLVILFEYLIYLGLKRWDLFYRGISFNSLSILIYDNWADRRRIYPDLFLMYVLFVAALIIMSVVIVFIPSQSLMLFLLFLDVVLCLLHVN